MPNGQNATIDAFLRPESMVTPGALGALAMLITNALANNFQFITHAYIAIFLSFVFGPSSRPLAGFRSLSTTLLIP
jgi:hypothetical protein